MFQFKMGIPPSGIPTVDWLSLNILSSQHGMVVRFYSIYSKVMGIATSSPSRIEHLATGLLMCTGW